jgi:hypothetical protein
MVQQLDEILSSADQILVVGVEQPSNVDPFVYHPIERGHRARSESPGSFCLPLRPVTVPLVVPSTTYSGGRPKKISILAKYFWVFVLKQLSKWLSRKFGFILSDVTSQ